MEALAGEWVLPGNYTFQDVRKLVKTRLHIAKRMQNFVVKDTVVKMNDTLDSYGEKFHVTLVISKRTCLICGQTHKLKACSACMNTYYCSSECQREDWPVHRNTCCA